MKVGLLVLLYFCIILQCCVAPPITKEKQEEKEEDSNGEYFQDIMHYHRYLKEVVGTLESDVDFKKKLEAADEADIRSGKIANQLEFVSHHVRTRLDEIKRQELDRLRTLTEQLNANEVIDDPNHGHLDHANPHTFEIEDLKKLIKKTTEDLSEADRKRREEFKQYELQKEYDKFNKLNHTNGDERQKLEKEYEELENKHKKHQPLHEPGHKAQLEEVWEEQDHMQQEFDPKTFFMMHDLDSNGYWDQDEVKALFVKELDKMYAAGAPEDDMRERVEEMERMREQVFQEVDLNKDNFIDFHEFLSQTKKQDFQQDHGWKGLDEQKPYSNEELEAYIRHQQMQPPPGYYPPGGHYPPGHYPPDGAYHPNQGPQYPGQHPPQYQGQHPNQNPQYQGQHPNQAPQYQGQHPNQVPQYQGQHPNQNPQYQGQHPNQNPQYHQGQHPNQIPPYQGQNSNNNPNQGYQQQQPPHQIQGEQYYQSNQQANQGQQQNPVQGVQQQTIPNNQPPQQQKVPINQQQNIPSPPKQLVEPNKPSNINHKQVDQPNNQVQQEKIQKSDQNPAPVV